MKNCLSGVEGGMHEAGREGEPLFRKEGIIDIKAV